MPKDNIERAIAKGTGAGADAEAYENVLYEGYGPGGVALLIEALTDNRNRTGRAGRHNIRQHRPRSPATFSESMGPAAASRARSATSSRSAGSSWSTRSATPRTT